jgi:hypothetical protein
MDNKLHILTRSFNPAHSSCSRLTPKNFRWTTELTPDNVSVLTDDVILEATAHCQPDRVLYGWLLESKAIIPDVYEAVSRPEVNGRFTKIFTCDRGLVKANPDKFVEVFAGSNLPWCSLAENPTKDKLCSMFCSSKLMCHGHIRRQMLAFRYQKQLDLYGGAHGSPRVGADGTPHPDKNILSRYMFSVVMENIQLDNYFTEKVTDCFATKTVPIYWGSPSIGEYFDMRGIILLDPDKPYDLSQLNAEMYQSMLPYVEENHLRVAAMKMTDDQIFEKVRPN